MAELTEQDLELQDLESRHGPEMIGSVARYVLLAGLAVVVLVPAIGQAIHGLNNPPMLELKLFGITWPGGQAAGDAGDAEAGLPPLEPGQTRVEGVVTFATPIKEPDGGGVYVNGLRAIAVRREAVASAQATPETPVRPREEKPAAGGEDPLLAHLRSYEAELETESFFVEPYQEVYNAALWLSFREGNRRVRAAGASPLFFRPNLTALFGRGPFEPMPISVSQPPPKEDPVNPWVGPVAAITDFAAQLGERGIQLVIAPVPSKIQIYPENLGLNDAEPLRYPWEDRLYAKLGEAGVEVIDLVDPLWQRREAAPLFLETDTHWTPTGMQVAAQAIARRVRQLEAWQNLPQTGGSPTRENFERRDAVVANQGDLNRMLGLEPPTLGPPEESAELTKITLREAVKSPGLDNPGSPVVLLGDSYVNVYHANSADVSWGDEAGLPEHLAWELGRPLATVAINGSGQTAARRELRRRFGALEGKKIVVWVLNSRSLFLPEALQRAENDKWEMVDFPEAAPEPAPIPADAQPEADEEIPEEFSALVWAFRNRKPQPGAELQAGDRVSLILQSIPDDIASEQKFDETDFLLRQFYAPHFQEE